MSDDTNPTHCTTQEACGATILQLERQLRKLIRAAEAVDHSTNVSAWNHLQDAIETAKAHLDD